MRELWISIMRMTEPKSWVNPFTRSVFARPGDDRSGESTTWSFETSPVLTGRSNEQERCDQAVVHAEWSAMDRNLIIALYLLYRRRKR